MENESTGLLGPNQQGLLTITQLSRCEEKWARQMYQLVAPVHGCRLAGNPRRELIVLLLILLPIISFLR
jgi:hypothetical protein